MTIKLSKTTLVNTQQAMAKRNWFLFDASGKTLGRFASELAVVLMGKHKIDYTPNSDTGDGVVVINADKLIVTGAKEAQKTYRSYTGHIGGRKDTPYRVLKEKKPTEILRHAVHGMMPKTKQTDAQVKRLRIFAGSDHDMQAQQPRAV
ncbi:MAG: 50S ribosomal protein L13 [Simkaniaceae bacterium]|nr:50S ribosomal protein L13 [Simkaniaceae bacterium]MCF7852705.1 50S ribosomal protein L13 [Simkaniaceae bacterium]